MLKGNSQILFLLIFSFLSIQKIESETVNLLWNNTHKGFYETGELRYICHNHFRSQKSYFKIIYYDKCGNLKLLATGTRESGCWKRTIEIQKIKDKNKKDTCFYIIPGNEEIEKDIRKNKVRQE
jgi:hypothetical protein